MQRKSCFYIPLGIYLGCQCRDGTLVGWVEEKVTIEPEGYVLWRTKLARTVVTKGWYREQSSRGGGGPQPPTLWLVDISEESDGLPRNIDGTPNVHVKHLACLFFGGGLELAHHGEPGIVINDVDATESNFRSPESVLDVIGVGYIDLED